MSIARAAAAGDKLRQERHGWKWCICTSLAPRSLRDMPLLTELFQHPIPLETAKNPEDCLNLCEIRALYSVVHGKTRISQSEYPNGVARFVP